MSYVRVVVNSGYLTHFGHGNILKYTGRPFKDVDEMDAVLIDNWNSVVQPNNVVWHLGDVAFHADPAFYLKKLNGTINVLYGNHDKPSQLRRCKDAGIINWCGDVKEIKWNEHKIWLSHYAHRTWPSSFHGSLHFYGHTHNGIPDFNRSCDVGVDTSLASFFPIEISVAVKKVQNQVSGWA